MGARATAAVAPPRRQDLMDSDDLLDYSNRVFGHLPRRDQRRWATVYLSGLLATPGRKSVRRLAHTLALPSSAAQALQQFITSSPWDWAAPRRELARLAAGLLPDAVWTTGTVLLRRGGTQAVGLHQRPLPESGRRVNCQLSVGLFLTDGRRSIPVDWELMLDDTWCDDPERRRRTRIPDEVTSRPVWALALEMLARAAADGVAGSAPLVHGPGAGRDASLLATHLDRAGREFVIEVPPHQPLTALPSGGPGPATVRTGTAAGLVADHVRTARPGRDGRRPLYSALVRFHSPKTSSAVPRRAFRLIAEIPPGRDRPSRFWLTSLLDTGASAVHALALRSAVTETSVDQLQNGLGLLDFEGRSFPGWHHHMTLASAAYLYRSLSGAATPARAHG
ncbi:IS701 family transposase [Streptomyces sp. NPDC058008]|uniref:IS701 family transposase n=1 Tax=Streptomyces sp. NPDC058008 TaxID=3346303 RepID=UPI0036E13EE2